MWDKHEADAVFSGGYVPSQALAIVGLAAFTLLATTFWSSETAHRNGCWALTARIRVLRPGPPQLYVGPLHLDINDGFRIRSPHCLTLSAHFIRHLHHHRPRMPPRACFAALAHMSLVDFAFPLWLPGYGLRFIAQNSYRYEPRKRFVSESKVDRPPFRVQ